MRQHPFTIPENDSDSLHFTVTPEEEGEIVFLLYQKLPAGNRQLVVKICVYALLPDLYHFTPYRGDLHVHSSHSSCSTRTEDPKFVAVMGRYFGLDFMALTDHIQYHGSEVAYDFIQSQNVAFQVLQQILELIEKISISMYMEVPLKKTESIINEEEFSPDESELELLKDPDWISKQENS